MSQIHVQLDNVAKCYGERTVLRNIDIEMNKGEFIAVVGKSGCGKSTLLRLIAGLESCTEGTILMDQNRLHGLNKKARIMFQDGRLLPWKRVIDNVGIALPENEQRKALQTLHQVGLQDRAQDWPRRLSGGQKQRVALARALVHNPELLLLDEPLGALDALTRLEMQALIESLWQERRFTAILVTHDVEEAVAIADRVLLIADGEIQLNQPIHLPRPRLRTQLEFTYYVEEILAKIMGRKAVSHSLMQQERHKVSI